MNPVQHILHDLSLPGAYLHPVRDLRVVQTHISCVFLTGRYAYKVKKPVDFEFLDYTTLPRRFHFCRQEVRLNRRLSPAVYLDVVPIVEEEGRLRVGAPGRPVEWAVRMRQLPEEDMLPARLTAGGVSASEVERLARVLAAFHARARRSARIRGFGSPAAIARSVQEAFPAQPPPAAIAPADHLEVIRCYLRQFQGEHEELFRQRAAKGRVRDCHGDLRAQNICLHPGLQGGVQILDCIEFTDRFRYLDVAADLAYLAMDLDLAGRADLREVLVRAYGEAARDADLEVLLPFYQCVRACVRGKIALLAAGEAEIPGAERQAHAELAAAAFDLARGYAGPRLRPLLLITVGFSASGKSVLACEIARRLPAVLLASDRIRKELAGVEESERLPGEWYTPERVAAVYAELRRRARQHLERGQHVLLEATFLAASEREAAQELAEECGAGFRVVECRCRDELIRERLRQRRQGRAGPSDADLAVYEAQLRAFQPPEGTYPEGWIPMETGRPAAGLAREVLERLWTRSG